MWMVSRLLLLVFLAVRVAQVAEMVENLTVRRVGYMAGEGVYPCIVRQEGLPPDPTLTYTTTFITNDSNHEISCSHELHPEPDETGEGTIHCFTPCSILGDYHLSDWEMIIVTGRDSDGVTVHFGECTISFKSVEVTATQRSGSVVEVAWQPQLNRIYQVQLWVNSHLGDNTVPPEAVSHREIIPRDEMSPLHRRVVNFLGERKDTHYWYRPGGLVVPGAPTIHEISGVVDCPDGRCRYYFLEMPESGDYLGEVLDVTEGVVYSCRGSTHQLDPYRDSLNIAEVVIESVGLDPDPAARPKTMTVITDDNTSDTEELTALVINGYDHSQAVETLPGQCLPLSDGCVIQGLETLNDPVNGGPVDDLRLLLVNNDQAVSSTVTVFDVLVRVRWADKGSVTVVWERSSWASQYTVRVLPQEGHEPPSPTIDCTRRGTACEATFSGLLNGTYVAEVTYVGEVPTTLTTEFKVEDGGSVNECHLPFQEIAGSCLMIETVVSGTWDEMNNLCHELGGQLVKVDSDVSMYDLVKYIFDSGLDNHSYWIGASDRDEEDNYRWLDGTEVKRGTPYWGYSDDVQEPSGGTDKNCVILNRFAFFYFYDTSCTNSHTAICEQVF